MDFEDKVSIFTWNLSIGVPDDKNKHYNPLLLYVECNIAKPCFKT